MKNYASPRLTSNKKSRDCTEKNVTTFKEWDFLLNIHLESVQKRVDTCFSDKIHYFNESKPGNPFLLAVSIYVFRYCNESFFA